LGYWPDAAGWEQLIAQTLTRLRLVAGPLLRSKPTSAIVSPLQHLVVLAMQAAESVGADPVSTREELLDRFKRTVERLEDRQAAHSEYGDIAPTLAGDADLLLGAAAHLVSAHADGARDEEVGALAGELGARALAMLARIS
jgi:hypothetical protein